MCRLVHLLSFRTLAFRYEGSVFVTYCPDGNVILDGEIMTLREATERVSKGMDFGEDFADCWRCVD